MNGNASGPARHCWNAAKISNLCDLHFGRSLDDTCKLHVAGICGRQDLKQAQIDCPFDRRRLPPSAEALKYAILGLLIMPDGGLLQPACVFDLK